jgi:putative ABC transport system substrate-binding protein
MNLKPSLWLITAILLISLHRAEAQQPTKVPRIGYLTGATPDGQAARIDSFRQGLRELGYLEGKTSLLNIDTQS